MKTNIVTILFMILFPFALQGQKIKNKNIEEYPIPKNLEQCFNLFNRTMTEKEKFLIKTLSEDSLYYNTEIGYETDFSFWLDKKSSLTQYFNKKGLLFHFEIYETILVSYHRYLNNCEINLAEQITKYIDKRRQESLEYRQKRDSIEIQYPLNAMIISSINSYIASDKDLVKQGFSLMDTSRYYVCVDGLPADFPYNSVQNSTFFSLNNVEGIPNFLKHKLNKGIKILFVWLKLTDRQLVIHIGGRGVKLIKKNQLGISVGDWGIFTYEYSCEKQKWELIETKFGGI
jgi:hypothetical protein